MNLVGLLRGAGAVLASRRGGSPADDERADETKLTIIEHLAELRTRLVWSAIAVVITTGISFAFAQRIFDFLMAPAGEINFIFIEVTEMMGAYFKVVFYGGLLLASPILIYQVVAFIIPAMTRQERRYALLLLPAIAVSFLIGAAFGYYVLLPPALNFMLNFAPEIATAQPRIGNYISVVTRLIFWIGIIFETPVTMYFLARLRLVNYPMLARYRRYAFVVAFILGAIITPTFDPINQVLVAGPLIVLFEIGLLLVRIA